MRTLAALLLTAPSALAQNIVIQHQGRLLDGGDQAVNGTHTLTFKIFVSPVKLPTETPVWTEDYTLEVRNGFYGVGLGDTADSHEVLPLTKFPSGEERYLTVNVDGEGDMEPRLRIGFMPYAAVALHADDADTADKALDLDCDHCVGPAELNFDPTPADLSVVTAKLADRSVTGLKIALGAVDTENIAAGAVGSAQIDAGAVGTAQLGANAVATTNIADLNVTAGKLADGAATTLKIADLNVTTGKLADLNVTTAKIADLNVTTEKLAAGAVTGTKIAGNAITSTHIGTGAIPWDRIEAGQVPSARLPPNPVASKTCAAGQAIQGFDSSGNPVCVRTEEIPPLVDRIKNVSMRGVGYLDSNVDWWDVPGFVTPIVAAGGPIEVHMSIPMNDGSHVACRPLIDGTAAGVFSGADTSYFWQEGISYTDTWWRMWNTARLYPNVAIGRHTVSIQCRNDDTGGGPTMGNSRMARTVHVIPYGPPASSEVKAYTGARSYGQTIAASSYSTITGLAVPFTAQGGPVRISWSIPVDGAGGTSSCRPLVDGQPAAKDDIDNTSSLWHDGLWYSANGWNMINRTRIYTMVPTGNHTATVECRTDTGSHDFGNSRMSLQLSVVTYKPTSDTSATVRAYAGVQHQQFTLPVTSTDPIGAMTTLTGLTTTFTSNGGPVEIGISIPLYSGSHTMCRPVIAGNPITTGEPDDFTYGWHDGIVYTGHGWAMYDRARIYRNFAAGTYTVGVQCRNDSGTAYAGHAEGVSHVWAVAYDR